MRRWILTILCCLLLKITFTQCIGDTSSPYFFCNGISRNLLNTYLLRAGAFSYVTDPAYTDDELDADLLMLAYAQPLWLGRVAGTWMSGANDAFEFERSAEIATRIHNEVSPYIILQAAIYEYVDPKVSRYSDWKVMIPSDILQAFGYPDYDGFTGYFEHDNIVYTDHPEDNTPDMSRIETQMWFYYRATRYIDAGYEAIHFGQFMIMNNNDPLNSQWAKLLGMIRTYASTHARRGIVLCDAHVNGKGCISYEGDTWDVPYLMHDPETPTDQLLFEYTSFGAGPDEFIAIPNQNNIYGDYDMLCRINYAECSMYGKGYGGKMPMDWGWSYDDAHPIPSIAEMDVGGTDEAGYAYEGMKTDGDFDPDGPEVRNIFGHCLSGCLGNGVYDFRTWGFGGESVWFALQSRGYRNYFNTYLSQRIPQLDPDIFCRYNLRMPITCSIYPWPGEIYNADFGKYNDISVIRHIWDDAFEMKFCTPENITTDFTIGGAGWMPDRTLRLLADVDGDGRDDIVGFSDHNVQIATSNGVYFTEATEWAGSQFTATNNFLTNNSIRLATEFNGDGKADLIAINENEVSVAISSGYGFFSPFIATSDIDFVISNNNTDRFFFGDFNGDGRVDLLKVNDDSLDVLLSDGNYFVPAAEGKGWTNRFSTAHGWDFDKCKFLIGDVNGDGRDDIVGFGNDTVRVGISMGTSFFVSDWLTDALCYNQGWKNENDIRMLADVNGDMVDDIVAFGYWGVQVAKSEGYFFDTPDYWIYDFGENENTGGWNNRFHVRTMADMNGDNKMDIVGFGNEGTVVSISTGECFTPIKVFPFFGNEAGAGGYSVVNHPRLIGDLDDDGKADIVGFGQSQVELMHCTADNAGISSHGEEDILTYYAGTDFKQILLYPNPCRNILNLQFNVSLEGTVTIFNATGTQVYSIAVNNHDIVIPVNTSLLQTGLYYVHFKSVTGESITEKFIIQ